MPAVPGSNLLNQALRVISPTTVMYYKWNGRIQDSSFYYVDGFSEGVKLRASVQAIKRSRYSLLGLDFQKNYIKIWASANLIDTQHDYSGDEFEYGRSGNLKRYKLVDNTDWEIQDGWASALAVEIKK